MPLMVTANSLHVSFALSLDFAHHLQNISQKMFWLALDS